MIFFVFLLLLLIPFGSANNISIKNDNRSSELRFLLIGDWGKGGNSGYASNSLGDNYEGYQDDDHKPKRGLYQEEQGGGHGQKQNQGKKNKATNQAAIAKAMGYYSDDFEPSFIIALGDNFYANGVSSSTDSYWEYLWVNVYLDYYSSLRVPWYPVFGD